MKYLAVAAAIAVLIAMASGCKTLGNSLPPAPQPTEASTEETTEPLTEASTEEATEPLTEASTEEATEPLTEASTEETTEPLTEASTEEATEPPTEQTEPQKPQNFADVENWPVFIVNEDYPLPENYAIETTPISQFAVIDKRVAPYALDMINAAKADGIELNVTSGYRSVEKQQENIEFYIENYMTQGYTYEEAERLTYSEVAKPGCSEHNAGLAMDIVTTDWFMSHTELTRDFQYTEEFTWLQENSWKFGFIMSFPEGKSHITGFDYEPWHYRFVGVELAKKFIESGEITLNEYLEKYR